MERQTCRRQGSVSPLADFPSGCEDREKEELRLLLIVEFVHQESAPLHSAFLRPIAPRASPRGQLDPHSRPLVGPGPLFISRTVFPARPAELWSGISRSGHSPFTDASALPPPGTGVQGRPSGQIKCSAVSESGSPSWSGRFLFLHKAVPRAEMPSFGNGSQCTQPACLIQVHIHLKASWPVQKESSQNGNPRILARKPTSAFLSPSYCPEFQQPLAQSLVTSALTSPHPCHPVPPQVWLIPPKSPAGAPASCLPSTGSESARRIPTHDALLWLPCNLESTWQAVGLRFSTRIG